MSTQNNVTIGLPNDTVVPLAHCPTLQDAHEALAGLARKYGVEHLAEDSGWGRYFNVVGKSKTRMFWVKQVGHARALKMIDFDELDGGLGDEWVGSGGEGEEERAAADTPGDTPEAVVLVDSAVPDSAEGGGDVRV
ncbi:hypothetical protein OPT61_g1592 [Boeremia exigua]|uniref:Uncharacterized protein n=1 Tax=Boeremia exigua TaxID=749465 RepID=A0ACC2IPP6_9PLEO|nr:hypothetical protein OPT61_g1592 [Boeremia exigua]